MYKCEVKSLENKIVTMSKFGDAGHGGVTRYALGPADIKARGEFQKRMEAIGAEVTTDDMACMYARLRGSDSTLSAIAMGSHTDSVKNGGNYDGILGVISAMEVLETVAKQKIPHKHDLVAMVWTNEEGSLYPPSLMASGVVCNAYLPEEIGCKFLKKDMLASRSILDGSHTFGQALEASPYKGAESNRISPKNCGAMFELHIEQGPILEAAGNDIGVVTCVLGMVCYRLQIYGQADHAGTTPMSFRHDALYGAARILLELHQELDKLDKELVYTTGEIVLHPNVHTVIPDFVEFSLDARHEDPKVIAQVVKVIEKLPKEIVGCRVEAHPAWTRDTVYYDKKLVGYVEKAVEELGYTHQRINSGAGHDAQFCAYMLPSTMIFVPSRDGHSHCELEHTSLKQCEQGVNVLLNAVLKCDAGL